MRPQPNGATPKETPPSKPARWPGLAIALLVFAGTLVLLFHHAMSPGHVLFSNDGPLGWLVAEAHRTPGVFTGIWDDLNSLGTGGSGPSPSITYGLLWLLGPVGFSKLYVPVVLCILGFAAWTFFRQLGLRPLACFLGGIAAMLNSGFFSAAAWGVGTHALTVALVFLALAAAVDTTSRRQWIRLGLAGLAVGMAVTEGADIGAIFSLFIAAFVLYQAWIAQGSTAARAAKGIGRLALLTAFAVFLASHAVFNLISTQIVGVAGTQQDTQTKQERWDWATQWSLPKRETLSFVVPGLFGYRMDTPQSLPQWLQKHYEGGVYWGAIGRDRAWDEYFAGGKTGTPPDGRHYLRFVGGGSYAGVLVVLVAAWAVAQAWRKKNPALGDTDRRWIRFWVGAAVIGLLLAWGRHAPFYQFLYALPYFSTIRNPVKFTYIVNWSLIVLFAYGIHGLARNFLEGTTAPAGPAATLKAWWKRVAGFDRRWTTICGALVGASALAWLIYSGSDKNLVASLKEVGYADQGFAEAIARFSSLQLGWAVALLAVAVALVTLMLSGAFAGARHRWAAVLLGLFMVFDLGRANLPWIITWDYKFKYASNPIIERLADKAYERRVAVVPGWIGQVFRAPQAASVFERLYGLEWTQHLFLYNNILSLDVIQMPRMPEDLMAFESALQPRSVDDAFRLVPRRWQLTSTRYLLGAADLVPGMNQRMDPAQQRFRILERFTLAAKPGVENPTRESEITAVPVTNGELAIIEFAGALPRASLFSNWLVLTNHADALTNLASPAFDPTQTVIVPEPMPVPPGTNNPSPAQAVPFVSYHPKHLVLKAEPKTPSILMVTDRNDANWHVYVDGKEREIIRCNYLMRGVYLEPGSRQVEFVYRPSLRMFYVSLAAVALAVVLVGLLVLTRERKPREA